MHEEDLKWVANTALAAAFIVGLGGTIFANYFGSAERCYLLTASLLIAAAFASFGGILHYRVKKSINERTIIHLDRKGKHPWNK